MMNINENQTTNSEINGNIKVENSYYIPSSSENNEVSFEEEFKKLIDTDDTDTDLIGFVGVNPLIEYDFQNYDIGETYNYDTKTIENTDAMFFLKVSSNGDTMNISLKDGDLIDATNYKTMEVSKTLSTLISNAAENNKALRLDFDNKVTVVLRVSREGKVDVSFFPQDKQVESYLKNNIDYLKVRFDEQSIAYSNISYKPYRQKENKRQGDKNE